MNGSLTFCDLQSRTFFTKLIAQASRQRFVPSLAEREKVAERRMRVVGNNKLRPAPRGKHAPGRCANPQPWTAALQKICLLQRTRVLLPLRSWPIGRKNTHAENRSHALAMIFPNVAVAQASAPAGCGGVSPPVGIHAPGRCLNPAAGTAALLRRGVHAGRSGHHRVCVWICQFKLMAPLAMMLVPWIEPPPMTLILAVPSMVVPASPRRPSRLMVTVLLVRP